MATATRKRSRRWAIRTVRGGRAVIGGVTYRPDAPHVPYDGRLDGMRFLFGRYETAGEPLPFVALWGTERHARHGDDWPGPECVDGSFPWYFWRREG